MYLKHLAGFAGKLDAMTFSVLPPYYDVISMSLMTVITRTGYDSEVIHELI